MIVVHGLDVDLVVSDRVFQHGPVHWLFWSGRHDCSPEQLAFGVHLVGASQRSAIACDARRQALFSLRVSNEPSMTRWARLLVKRRKTGPARTKCFAVE